MGGQLKIMKFATPLVTVLAIHSFQKIVCFT